MAFTTRYDEILAQVKAVDPLQYGRTRNYLNGAVTRLSPYISRGVISTREVFDTMLAKGIAPAQMESFIKELAWRDYFQQVWIALGDEIQNDIKRPQPDASSKGIPKALLHATTGIEAIDNNIRELQATGYMHNHVRMYTASLACNLARCHWQVPARWMHYYLLDADGASNTLSWQWVAGSFSGKKYYANQENINRYCNTMQSGTFLDQPYESLESMDVPDVLKPIENPEFRTALPECHTPVIDTSLPTYIYNFYNLDCMWDNHITANRILLLEPSFFERYPVCEKTITFILNLSHNIPGIQPFTGEFHELQLHTGNSKIHFKEHPTARHYRGTEHPRAWMFENVKGYYPSFFAYWKQCEKQLKKQFSIKTTA